MSKVVFGSENGKTSMEDKINIAGSTLKGSRIVECLKGKFPTAYGFKWEYK